MHLPAVLPDLSLNVLAGLTISSVMSAASQCLRAASLCFDRASRHLSCFSPVSLALFFCALPRLAACIAFCSGVCVVSKLILGDAAPSDAVHSNDASTTVMRF